MSGRHDARLLLDGRPPFVSATPTPAEAARYADWAHAVRAAGVRVAPAPTRSTTMPTPRTAGDTRRDLDAQHRRLGFRLGADVDRADAFRRWLRCGARGLTETEARVLTSEAERRDIGVSTGAAGGYLTPQVFYNEVAEALRIASAVRSRARIFLTPRGTDAPLPQVDDTANVGLLQAENVATTPLDVPFTQVTLHSYAYQSGLIKMSWQLLQDEAFPIDEWLAPLLAQRIARVQNLHFTTGSGTGQPQGFVTGGITGVTLATGNATSFSTGAIGYNALVSLVQSTDPAYRRLPSCAFQMADATWTAVQELADSQGRPLFLPTHPELGPTLLGFPVALNNDMPAMAASAKAIAFGAWERHYVVRDVAGVLLHELVERFADQLQRGVIGFLRSDGRIADPKAVRLLAMSAT